MKTKDKLKRVALSIHLGVDSRVLTRFDQDFTYKGEHYSVKSLDEVDPTPEMWENDYTTVFFGEIDGDFYTNEVDTIEIDGTVHKLTERQTYFIFKTE